MSNRFRHAAALTALCVLSCLGLAAIAQEDPAAAAADDEAAPESATLARPKWKEGQTWMIETVSEKIQGREITPARKPVPIRWQFKVANMEKLAGRDCYRIEIECLARGRIRPKSVIWVDEQTGFMRQYETELAVAGQMRKIVESNDHAKDQVAPTIMPISALPIAMPAFLPKGSKANSFSYTSAPIPAGGKAKDLGLMTFAHEISQTTKVAGSKSLEALPKGLSKSLEAKPVTEVQLATHNEKITQLWQQGQPWPVYVDNGRTKAYLVTDE
jgi:hypothetical protein